MAYDSNQLKIQKATDYPNSKYSTPNYFKPSQFHFTLCNMKNTDFLLEFLYNNETKDVKTLQAKAGLPLSTIYRKIKVLKEKGELKRNKGSGRPRIFSGNAKKAISQIALKMTTMKR